MQVVLHLCADGRVPVLHPHKDEGSKCVIGATWEIKSVWRIPITIAPRRDVGSGLTVGSAGGLVDARRVGKRKTYCYNG